MRHDESRIQQSCVWWFRHQYAPLSRLLFAVPNGGRRDAVTGAILKAEGVVAGVADLILLFPSSGYHGLCIEMKTRRGQQRDTQKEWQAAVEKAGYKYIVCRSLEQFMGEVRSYLLPQNS